MKNQILRIFMAGLLGWLALPAEAQRPQVMYATLQPAQQPSRFLNAALKPGTEAGKGFFPVTGNALQAGRATYMIVGTVRAGSTITLKGADGRFLSCCSQGPESAQFIIRLYSAEQVSAIQASAKAAQNTSSASAFTGLDADDGAGK